MRRLISIVLLISLVLSVGINVYAEPFYDDFSAKAELLEELGIIDKITDEAELEAYTTRRDFIIMAAKMIGINVFEVNPNRYYSDMTEDDLGWNAAAALLERRILTMNDSRTFRPNDTITRDEAACVLIKILGVTGADYETTLTIARRCEILDGVANSEITKADAIVLLHNALNTCMFDYAGTENGSFKVEQGTETLMEVYYDMFHTEGVVNAVNETGIDGSEGYGENTICIGETVLNAEMNDPYKYLGYYVSAYYTNIDDITELKYISVREKHTESTVVDAESFVGFDSGSYTVKYYENDKIKTVSVDKGANLIRNGENISDRVKDAFDSFKKGEIVLINSDGNGACETVIINSYEDIVVNYVDTANKLIYGTKGQVIDLSDISKTAIITNAGGEKMTLSDIAKDNTVSLYASSKMNRLVISNITVTGEITALTVKDGKTNITVNQTGYEADKAFTDANPDFLKAGNRVTAYINAYGKAVDFKTAGASGGMYAWIITHRVEEHFDKTMYLKLFTENGEIVSLAVADNVKIDGNKCETIDAAESALSVANGKIDEQLVIVSEDAEGIIRTIDTKAEGSLQNGLFVSSDMAEYWFFSGQMVMGPKVHINSSTKLFVVPESEAYKNDANSYQIVKGNSFFKDWVSYKVEGYRTGNRNSLGYTEAMLTKTDLMGTGSALSHVNVFVVKGAGEVYDEENSEVREQLTLLAGKAEQTFMNAEGYSFMNNPVVKAGNVVKIKVNSRNEITDITLLYGEKTNGSTVTDSNNTVALNQSGWGTKDSYAIGYVTDVENGLVGFSMEKGGETFLIGATANKPVAVYDPTTTEKVFVGGENDLIDAKNKGYKVVVDISRGNIRSYSVVKVNY